MKILLVVAVALMNEKNEVLLAERPKGKQLAGCFEYPGGKVEEGELPEAALIREVKEELGIVIEEKDLEPLNFISHAYPEYGFHLVMPTYLCRIWQGEPQALEHASIRWTHPDDMDQLLMIEADKPLIDALKRVVA